MITLSNVNLSIIEAERHRPILKNASFTFDEPRLALMDADPKVRTSLINMLAQQIKPQSGHIKWQGRLSWPIGRTLPFRSSLTGFEQIDFISTIYDLPRRRTLDLVTSLMEDSSCMRLSFINWPSVLQMQFAYSVMLAPQFDIYLFDGSARLPYVPFFDRWKAAFQERLKGRMLIMATGQPLEYPRWCAKGVEIDKFAIRPVDDIIEKANALRAAPVIAADTAPPAQEQEEEDLDLF